MTIAQSKITAQGQISVPARVRKALGVGPGSFLVWEEKDGEIIVRRVTSYSTEDIHRAAFPDGPPERRTLAEMKEGIRQHMRKKHASH